MALHPTDQPTAAEYMRAARAMRWQNGKWVMAFHPVARLNPFQALLYRKAWSSGFAPVATLDLDDVTALPHVHELGVGSILHLHWTSGIMGNASSPEEAEHRIDCFLHKLDELQRQGTRIVWTLHNRLPHRCAHLDLEVQLRSELTRRVDVVHVMTPETMTDVSDLYDLPQDRTLVASHPSYVDAYPRHFNRELARFELGFDRADFVVGLVGSLQPYKGLNELVYALEELGGYYRGIIAGPVGQDAVSKEMLADLRHPHNVRIVPAKLDADSLSKILSSVDVIALPYRSSLNSGAGLLALSFGVPLIAPKIGAFKALAEKGFCLAYDPTEGAGLLDALKQAPEWVKMVDRTSMSREMEKLSPENVSKGFFAELNSMLMNRHREV